VIFQPLSSPNYVKNQAATISSEREDLRVLYHSLDSLAGAALKQALAENAIPGNEVFLSFQIFLHT